jgi:hypothetical protein
MSFRDVVTVWRVTSCDGCGVEDAARSDDDGEYYPPAGWRELPTGEHACSRRCVDLIRDRKERAA